MKKSVIFLLAFALIFVFVSCGTQSGGKPSKNLKFGGKELTLKYVSSEETEDGTKVDVYKRARTNSDIFVTRMFFIQYTSHHIRVTTHRT